MNVRFVRGENPKGSMNVGLKAVIYNKLKKFFDEEIILSGRRGMESFFSFYPDYKGNYYFEAPITKTWMEEIIKEHNLDEYLEFPGEYINKQKIPQFYTLSFKIKEPFVEFFNAVKARDFILTTESVNFERGIDPKASMGIGQIGNLHPGTLLKCLKRISPKVKDYNNFYIEKNQYSIIKKIKATHNQIELEIATYDKFPKHFKKVDLQFIGGEYLTITPAEFFDHFEVVKDDQLGESINFERGMEPKRAMKVGHHRNDLFNEIQSMSFIEAMKSFPELGSDNDRKILALAAHMLEVPQEQVRIAMDRGTPIYNDNPLMDEYIARQWEYGKEDTLESGNMNFDLIGSSTGEIYVKDSKSDEFLYILGAIN